VAEREGGAVAVARVVLGWRCGGCWAGPGRKSRRRGKEGARGPMGERACGPETGEGEGRKEFPFLFPILFSKFISK